MGHLASLLWRLASPAQSACAIASNVLIDWLGNIHVKTHRYDLYAALARQWLTGLPQILIVVDGSSLTADMQWHRMPQPECLEALESVK